MSSFKDYDCICHHFLIPWILNEEILRVQLLTHWDSSRSAAEISNK